MKSLRRTLQQHGIFLLRTYDPEAYKPVVLSLAPTTIGSLFLSSKIDEYKDVIGIELPGADLSKPTKYVPVITFIRNEHDYDRFVELWKKYADGNALVITREERAIGSCVMVIEPKRRIVVIECSDHMVPRAITWEGKVDARALITDASLSSVIVQYNKKDEKVKQIIEPWIYFGVDAIALMDGLAEDQVIAIEGWTYPNGYIGKEQKIGVFDIDFATYDKLRASTR